jgi:hypothetical protein
MRRIDETYVEGKDNIGFRPDLLVDEILGSRPPKRTQSDWIRYLIVKGWEVHAFGKEQVLNKTYGLENNIGVKGSFLNLVDRNPEVNWI